MGISRTLGMNKLINYHLMLLRLGEVRLAKFLDPWMVSKVPVIESRLSTDLPKVWGLWYASVSSTGMCHRK